MTRLRALDDQLPAECRILFVGLNPGIRSAEVGHHFAGPTNKFWRLMSDAGFLPKGSSWPNDRDMPSYGLGITNLVARPTVGISDLRSADYARGREILRAKILRIRPRIVAMVGITVYRNFFVYREFLRKRAPLSCGLSEETVEGIPCWILPNPSGRNAHFTYRAMLREFARLHCFAVERAPATTPRRLKSPISRSS